MVKIIKMKASVSLYLFLSLCGLSSALFRKHFYVNKGLYWQDAQKYCREHHDDLSTASKQEAKQLTRNPEVSNSEFWVGLNTLNSTEWVWSGGEEEAFDYWDDNEPNSDTEPCTALKKSNSKLFNVVCERNYKFYCMERFELILVQDNKTWEEALDYCRQNYIDLVSIDSVRTMAEAINNTMTSQTVNVWIGLRFLAGHWFWVNGGDVEYKAWSEGELQCPPENLQCGALDTENKRWKPEDCGKRLNFFCLKKYKQPEIF
ncbi:lymphocyte antigen 75-like [Misgurnus anguillicaudatus]|uniref:lymphocyte antigen 75-like n=1 Tax=Misgurnus anguillicaudatus TaxID=75329 RepID=UPI003CCFD41C